MLTTNTNFDTKHALDYKSPLYIVQFDGEKEKYTNTYVELLGSEVLSNIGFETAGGGGADVFGSWTESAGDGAIEDEGLLVHGDLHAAKLTSGPTYNTYLLQGISETIGMRYLWTFWTRGDGTNAGRYCVYNNDTSTYAVPWTSTGITGTDYAQVIVYFVCESTQTVLYFAPASSNGAIAYFDDVSCKEIITREYLTSISGLSQKVTPEEGKASIGGFKIGILNVDNEITALLATDSYYFHRKKATIKAGYLGMDESDLLTVSTVWVTDYELSDDLTTYTFDLTDPKKWMQRKIFRGSETTPVTISGNAINILLSILTSTGAGTNGDYDRYAEENSLGIDADNINVSDLEAIRDDWFPGDSHYMKFTITERIVAKDFIENELCKVLNCYPIVDGQGRFSIRPFKPPIASRTVVQSFNDDNIRGFPKFNANLESVVNEVEVHYDWDSTDEEFDTEVFYVDANSLDNRGPGKRPITIKSKGLYSSLSPSSMAGRAEEITNIRKQRIFGRFATPPTAIKFKTHFSRWLSDAGDIVPITCSKLPDITAGSIGLTANRMEVVNRSIDWIKGEVTIDLLDTGFARDTYGAISPTMTITTSTASTCFTVSTADAEKYANFTSPEVQILDAKMRQQAASITITNVDTTTGIISCDDMGAVSPVNGYVAAFADYDNCSTEQQLWNFVADSSNDLGSGDDNAHIICP